MSFTNDRDASVPLILQCHDDTRREVGTSVRFGIVVLFQIINMIADRARFGFFHVEYDENRLGGRAILAQTDGDGIPEGFV